MTNETKHRDDLYFEDNYMDQVIDGELKLGARYSTFVELQNAVDVYCKKNNVRFFRSDSRKLKSAPNRINPQIIEKTPDYLVYYSLTYTCVFGGKSFKCRNKPDSSVQDGCKFIIRIGLTKNCQMLQVIKMSDPKIHNHELSESILADMPKVRSSLVNTNSSVKAQFKSQPSREEKKVIKKPLEPVVSHKTKSGINEDQLMHEHNLAMTLSKYRETGLFCDTAIVARDGMLYAHSAVLALNCPMFYSLVNQQPFYKPKSNMIDLAKYTSAVINNLLDFFYFGKISMKHLPEVQELAEALGMKFNIVDDDNEDDENDDAGSENNDEEDDEDEEDVGDTDAEELNASSNFTNADDTPEKLNDDSIRNLSPHPTNKGTTNCIETSNKSPSKSKSGTTVNPHLDIGKITVARSEKLNKGPLPAAGRVSIRKNVQQCVRCKKSFFSKYDYFKHKKFWCKFNKCKGVVG